MRVPAIVLVYIVFAYLGVSVASQQIFIDQVPGYSKLPNCAVRRLSLIVRNMASGCGDGGRTTSFSCFCASSTSTFNAIISTAVTSECAQSSPTAAAISALDVFKSYCHLSTNDQGAIVTTQPRAQPTPDIQPTTRAPQTTQAPPITQAPADAPAAPETRQTTEPQTPKAESETKGEPSANTYTVTQSIRVLSSKSPLSPIPSKNEATPLRLPARSVWSALLIILEAVIFLYL